MNNPFEIIEERINGMEKLLKEVSEKINTIQRSDADDLGGMELAEQVTGLKKATLYVKVSKNQIPHFKRGGKVYFSKNKLLEWITQSSNDDLSKEKSKQVILFPRHRTASVKPRKRRLYE